MSLENKPPPEKLAATSFRVDGDVLVCSGPAIAERRIPFSQIRMWVDIGQGRVPTFSLMFGEGASLYLEDPDGVLDEILSDKIPERAYFV